MLLFALRKYEPVEGNQTFFELLKNGKSQMEEFTREISSNVRYASESKTILAYMNMVADDIMYQQQNLSN